MESVFSPQITSPWKFSMAIKTSVTVGLDAIHLAAFLYYLLAEAGSNQPR